MPLNTPTFGAPDFEIAKKEPIEHIEAKVVGVDLRKVQKPEQLLRYLPVLNKLLLTDCISWTGRQTKV